MGLDPASVDAAATVLPFIPEMARFIKGMPNLTTVPAHIQFDKAPCIWAPVICIRWACPDPDADATDSYMGAYSLVEDLLCGRQRPGDVAPLEVALENGRLWALSGQRLAALKMYQALRGAELVKVRCVVRHEDAPQFNRAQACRQRGWGLNLCSLNTARSSLGSPLVNPMSQMSTITPFSSGPPSTLSSPCVPCLKPQSGVATHSPSGTYLQPVPVPSPQATSLMEQFSNGPLEPLARQRPPSAPATTRSTSARSYSWQNRKSSCRRPPLESNCIAAICKSRSDGETKEALSDAIRLFRSADTRVGVRENFVSMGGIEAVVAAIRRLPKSSGVLKVGCDILHLSASMWRDCSDGGPSAGADIIAAGGVDVLISGMVDNLGDTQVQAKACAVLSELACGVPKAWADAGCIEQLIKCSKMQCNGNALVQCNICKVIPLAVRSPAGRAKLVETGCVREMIATAYAHLGNPEIQDAVCKGLSSIAIASEECHAAVVGVGGERTAIAALQNCSLDRSAVSSGCGALRDILRANSDAAAQAGEMGAVESVVRGLRKHWGDADVAQNACGALISLCAYWPNRQKAAEVGAIQTATEALKLHGVDPVVRQTAIDVLKAVTAGDALKRQQMMQALKFANVVTPDELL